MALLTNHKLERLLDLWEREVRVDDIAAELELEPGYVRVIVANARKAGESRATRRKAGMPRTKRVTRALTLVASGLSYAVVEERTGISRGALAVAVCRHRKAGDARFPPIRRAAPTQAHP